MELPSKAHTSSLSQRNRCRDTSAFWPCGNLEVAAELFKANAHARHAHAHSSDRFAGFSCRSSLEAASSVTHVQADHIIDTVDRHPGPVAAGMSVHVREALLRDTEQCGGCVAR